MSSTSRAAALLLLAVALTVLPAAGASSQATITRGPYLQLLTDDGVVVRWRTDQPTDSAVSFGAAPGSLTSVVADPALVADHEIALALLAPDTRYYYAVGTTAEALAGDDADHSFVTAPAAGTAKPTRLWVVGDSGTAHLRQLDPLLGEVRDAQGVRDSFLAYTGTGATLVTAGATWKYLDDGSDQGAAWREPGFDDSSWSSGPSKLGCGDDAATFVNSTNPPACDNDSLVTAYFRHAFTVADASRIAGLTLTLLRDDGAVVYLNGTEVLRTNMPPDPIDAATLASQAVVGSDEIVFRQAAIDPALLVDGANVLAAEVHQVSLLSSDLGFDLELFARTDGAGADLWLMLGDNAYNAGSQNEWQQAVFNPYPTLLANTALWPSLGNHDIRTLNGQPYLDNLTLPTGADAGGVASGSERYYSFDYGNIHLIALDSDDDAGRQPGSAMLAWLASDLAATTQDWIIAYWHHPPYSDGTHDSDNEIELIEIRENVVPILEGGGVDLVLGGHSHGYERSALIDGFTATPTTVLDGTFVDPGDGCVTSGCDGPYNKPAPGPHQGAVYAVVGNSGRNILFAPTPAHPLMVTSVNDLGSMIIDIDGDRLDATVINRACATVADASCVLDRFTIVKGAVQPVYLDLSTTVASVAPGGVLPFTIELENITEVNQGFGFALFLTPPAIPPISLVQVALGLPPLTAVTAGPAIPLPATAPTGTWHLTGAVFQPGPGLIDSSDIAFTVE